MITRQLNKNDFVTYNSINEMVSHMSTWEGRKNDSISTYDPYWYGSKSYEEAESRILKGDDELAKKLRGSEKLDIHMPSTGVRRKMCTGVTGFMPHVPNFLANVPNNMIYTKEDKIVKKVITVIYGCNTRCEASVDEIAKVSARVISCVMSLERKGYRIHLYASNVAKYGNYKTGFITKLKDAGQHIDTLKMAFPLLSASWNRRFGFRFREMCGWYGPGGSLDGYDLRKYLDKNKVKYDVALSYYDAKDISTVKELEDLFVKNIKTKK